MLSTSTATRAATAIETAALAAWEPVRADKADAASRVAFAGFGDSRDRRRGARQDRRTDDSARAPFAPLPRVRVRQREHQQRRAAAGHWNFRRQLAHDAVADQARSNRYSHILLAAAI